MDSLKNYTKLKDIVFRAVGKTYDLELLKNFFRTDIDSLRTLNNVKSFIDLIEILEERDVLSSQCPMPLFYIGQLLKNDTITTTVEVYKNHLVTDPKCSCGLKLNYCPIQIDVENSKCCSDSMNSPDSVLLQAIDNVAERIGPDWRTLTSELNIFEYQIDAVYKEHPTDFKKQAKEALLFWIKNDKLKATVEQLDEALNARLCQKKGIGSHLRMSLL